MPLHLPAVFAIYNIPKSGGNRQYVGISGLFFESLQGKKTVKIPLNEIVKIVLERRHKLAPLIGGGIITSFGMLSLLLYSSQMEIVALVAAGLLLSYYGIQEYPVIHIEHGNTTRIIWLPVKVDIKAVRPLVGIAEYYINRQHFPVVYAYRPPGNNQQLVHYETRPVASSQPVYYSFSNHLPTGEQPVAVALPKLDAPVTIEGNEKFIGYSNYLINQDALIEQNPVTYS